MMHNNEEMAQCPYNRSHIVLKHRLASHLVKCRRQNPLKGFMRCPFNSGHDIPAPEFENHIKTCEDRKQLESFLYVVGEPKQEKNFVYHSAVNSTEENWDEEPIVAGSYLDEKDKINKGKMFSRLPPTGMSKSEKKAFYVAESQRLKKIVENEMTLNSSGMKQNISSNDSNRSKKTVKESKQCH